MLNILWLGEYFGFSDQEVDVLYDRYCEEQEEPRFVSRDELRRWYDGYATPSGVRLYNPRSVVLALTNNNLDNYWTSSGPYDEIFYYITQTSHIKNGNRSLKNQYFSLQNSFQATP